MYWVARPAQIFFFPVTILWVTIPTALLLFNPKRFLESFDCPPLKGVT